MNNNIQVSVCIVTYNQENYIAKCLDSIVRQKTNFRFEIIVGEDCSTDNTRAIIQEYVEKYPELIVPIFYEKNVGAVENIRQVYKKAKGKYIAHIDGDDLMLSGKLQKQFDILEANPNAIMCTHNMTGRLINGKFKKHYWYHQEGEYAFIDLVKKLPFFAHSSKFFRVVDSIDLESVLKDPNTLDIEMHLHQSLRGSIVHLEDDLGIYAVNVGVSSVKDNKMNQTMILRVSDIYDQLLVSHPNIKRQTKQAYSHYLLSTAYSYAVFESDANKMKSYTISSLKQGLFSVNQIAMLFLSGLPSIGIRILKIRHKRSKNNFF